MDPVPAAPSSVAAIFARAERVFERRVDQLLHVKRAKARVAGTPFNARKAKRDARTVAGREKLDALVRRLADLAAIQEKALGEKNAASEAAKLDAAAVAVVAFAALAHREKEARTDHDQVRYLDVRPVDDYVDDPAYINPPDFSTQEITEYVAPEFAEYVPRSPPPYVPHDMPVQVSPMSPEYAAPVLDPVERAVCEDPDSNRDVLDTSSCSDDASLTGGPANFKDALEPDVCDVAADPRRVVHHQQLHRQPRKGTDRDRHIFPATESVVNFVLECDDDGHNAAVQHPGSLYRADMRHADRYPGFEGYDNRFPTRPLYDRYDCRRLPPPCTRPDWPPRGYPMQSASSL